MVGTNSQYEQTPRGTRRLLLLRLLCGGLLFRGGCLLFGCSLLLSGGCLLGSYLLGGCFGGGRLLLGRCFGSGRLLLGGGGLFLCCSGLLLGWCSFLDWLLGLWLCCQGLLGISGKLVRGLHFDELAVSDTLGKSRLHNVLLDLLL